MSNRCTKINCPMLAGTVSDDCYDPNCPWKTETYPAGNLFGWAIEGNINTNVFTARHPKKGGLSNTNLQKLIDDIILLSCVPSDKAFDDILLSANER